MYAYVINHFGAHTKILRHEIFFILNLKKYTNYDIIYLYSINDTPEKFIEIIKQMNINTIAYNDEYITYNVRFQSAYSNFNTLRTCNYIYAYKLTQYEKVCLLESDMVILKSIDDIFNLRTPASKFHMHPSLPHMHQNVSVLKQKDFITTSPINGGVMLLKPSVKMFDRCIKKLPIIINNVCKFPNEALFILSNKTIYNLPIKYNFSKHMLQHVDKVNELMRDVRLIHFDGSTFKPADILDDAYEIKEILKPTLKFYKENIYDPNLEYVNSVLKELKL